jgi:hypothetical protein
MDAGTWDEDRIDRCCTPVIRPDGKLDSFCRYYADPVLPTSTSALASAGSPEVLHVGLPAHESAA